MCVCQQVSFYSILTIRLSKLCRSSWDVDIANICYFWRGTRKYQWCETSRPNHYFGMIPADSSSSGFGCTSLLSNSSCLLQYHIVNTASPWTLQTYDLGNIIISRHSHIETTSPLHGRLLTMILYHWPPWIKPNLETSWSSRVPLTKAPFEAVPAVPVTDQAMTSAISFTVDGESIVELFSGEVCHRHTRTHWDG